MFSKKNRISKKKEFEKIFKEGKGKYIKTLGLKYLKNDLNINRFAVIVSTKVSKKAVQRNKIKRQIRSILKKQNYKKEPTWDIVIIALTPILERKYIETEKEISFLLKNQGLLK